MFRHDLGDGAELRILEPRHAAEFLDYLEPNRAYLGQWLGWATTITTLEAAQAFLQRSLTRFAEDALPWVGIWQDNQMAGGILWFPIERPIRATEIGYWLGEAYTGRGLMTRAIRAMLTYAFDDLHLNRVMLRADVNNRRSRAVAERLGFTFEGIERDGWVYHEAYIDMARYAMLARDWAARAIP